MKKKLLKHVKFFISIYLIQNKLHYFVIGNNEIIYFFIRKMSNGLFGSFLNVIFSFINIFYKISLNPIINAKASH